MKFKTSYAGHDMAYQKLRKQGAAGWDQSEQNYTKFKGIIENTIAKGTAPTSGTLLEIGCGAGNMTPWLFEKGYTTYGVDISITAIEWARQRAEQHGMEAQFTVGDVCDLAAYEDGFFDFVLDKHCLHCIIGPDRARVLGAVRRVLKPGGYFLMITMCGPLNCETLEGFDSESGCVVCKGIATRYIGMPENLVAEVQTAGFKVVQWHVEPDVEIPDLVLEAVKSS